MKNCSALQTVMQMMKVMCKCHGVSGSCELKTCWRSLPNFAEVGQTLRSKFDSALQVDFRKKRLLSRDTMREVPQTELAFLRPSPDFCYADEEAGSVGTRGRECNKTLSAPNNCNQLCCRRGFSTRIVVQAVQCNCKFVWCCSVRCEECRMPVEVSKCLWPWREFGLGEIRCCYCCRCCPWRPQQSHDDGERKGHDGTTGWYQIFFIFFFFFVLTGNCQPIVPSTSVPSRKDRARGVEASVEKEFLPR